MTESTHDATESTASRLLLRQAELGDIDAIDEKLPPRDILQSQQHTQKGAFARARMAGEKGHGTSAELHVQITQRFKAVGIPLGYAVKFYISH